MACSFSKGRIVNSYCLYLGEDGAILLLAKFTKTAWGPKEQFSAETRQVVVNSQISKGPKTKKVTIGPGWHN